ncbi:hypothetical protein CCH79_00003389 [Gambusia affinis]|uniref:Protein kinase domain-containing protein n=1 Tax=Gambusia affinis TaxID=33528 RepID=A0A315VFD0_GAMAF|nr:hypothetical protein CCH79_00003389 [Gambusia affinis]
MLYQSYPTPLSSLCNGSVFGCMCVPAFPPHTPGSIGCRSGLGRSASSERRERERKKKESNRPSLETAATMSSSPLVSRANVDILDELQLIAAQNLERLEVNKYYEVIRELGKGTYGKVDLVIHKIRGTKMALKFLKKKTTKLKSFLREYSISLYLSPCPFIINMYGIAFETDEYYVFAQEYALAGDLFDIIPPQWRRFTEQALRMFRRLLSVEQDRRCSVKEVFGYFSHSWMLDAEHDNNGNAGGSGSAEMVGGSNMGGGGGNVRGDMEGTISTSSSGEEDEELLVERMKQQTLSPRSPLSPLSPMSPMVVERGSGGGGAKGTMMDPGGGHHFVSVSTNSSVSSTNSYDRMPRENGSPGGRLLVATPIEICVEYCKGTSDSSSLCNTCGRLISRVKRCGKRRRATYRLLYGETWIPVRCFMLLVTESREENLTVTTRQLHAAPGGTERCQH